VARLGAMLGAGGEFTSALTRNQIVAYMTGAAVLLGLFLGGLLLPFLIKGARASEVLAYFNLYEHVRDFARGVVDSRHVVYYVSVTVFSLFLATRVIESSKWR